MREERHGGIPNWERGADASGIKEATPVGKTAPLTGKPTEENKKEKPNQYDQENLIRRQMERYRGGKKGLRGDGLVKNERVTHWQLSGITAEGRCWGEERRFPKFSGSTETESSES